MQERTFSLSSAADAPHSSVRTRSITIVRAVIALVWAGALAVAVGDDVPTTASDVPALVALLLTAYPLIDVVALRVAAPAGAGRDAGALRLGAALSALAAVGLALATFAGDAGATLVVFGAWAFASGAVQLAVALRHWRAGDRQPSLVLSGALSTVVGVVMAAASSQHDAHLGNLAGYAALGAVFFLVAAARTPRG